MHPHPDEWWQCHNYFMNLCSDRDLVHLAVHILANNYNDNDNNNYASYICPDCDLVHLSAHIVAKKTGQTCLSLVLHMLMPEVFLETSFKRNFLILLLIYQVCGPYRAGKLYEQCCLSCLPQGRTSSSWTHSSREREVEVEIRRRLDSTAVSLLVNILVELTDTAFANQ